MSKHTAELLAVLKSTQEALGALIALIQTSRLPERMRALGFDTSQLTLAQLRGAQAISAADAAIEKAEGKP